MKPSENKGFTLIELMVVIAIIGIIAGIAIPNFISWLPKHRLNAAAQDVFSGLVKARSTAVKEYATVVFDAANTTVSAFINDGAGGPVDADGVPANAKNLTQEGDERTVVRISMPSGVRVVAPFQTIFDRRGFPSATGTIQLRNSNNRVGSVTLQLTGNIDVQLPTH